MEPFVGPSGEFLEHIAKVGEGFHAIEFARLDEGVEGGRSLATGIVSGKEEVLAADGNPPQRPLHGIIIDAEMPLLKIEGQRLPALQRIADGLGNGAFGGHLRPGIVEPGPEGFQ